MLRIRPAVAEDALAVAQAHVRSWQKGYYGLLPQDYLDALNAEERASRYGFEQMSPDGPFTQVAVDGQTVCGHVTTGRSREPDLPGAGEIWALYVDPPSWGRGVGRRLISAGCQQLLDRGHHTAVLWVMAGNLRARSCYEQAGWHEDGTQRTDAIGEHPVHEVRYQTALSAACSSMAK
jgi:ribosomal protein S18 acetylase RimI-like enzyme